MYALFFPPIILNITKLQDFDFFVFHDFLFLILKYIHIDVAAQRHPTKLFIILFANHIASCHHLRLLILDPHLFQPTFHSK